MSEPTDSERVEKAVEHLGEFFDTVQIFVSRHGCDGTTGIAIGRGNYYARVRQAQEWSEKETEGARIDVRKFRDNADE